MNYNDFWILLTACLVSLCCVIPGCFLVLRKMSMLGDAISHAVLPGLVIAYLISGSKAGPILLTGAAVTGILVAVAIEFIHKKFRMPQDASIGITYTFLFAVGVILISRYAGQVDLDQECVLYGEIAYVPFDLYGEIPRQVLISGALFVILLSTLLMGYRGLKLTTFDPAYASSIGISVLFWHYLIMGMVSITTVISFESVGAVLVIALLVGPAATASLFATKLNQMILISGFIGVLTSIGGYTLATFLNASIAGCIAVVTGIAFLTGVVIKKYLIR